MELLAIRDVDDLSLREIARRVGVSASAVYRHFPDKEALMRALATEGLEMLYVAQREASERAGGGIAGFTATGSAYIRFAVGNAALFRQIYSNPPFTHHLSETGELNHAMAFLRENAAQFAASDDEARLIALQAWSLAHGLAMLLLDEQVPFDETEVSDMFTHWAHNLVRRPE